MRTVIILYARGNVANAESSGEAVLDTEKNVLVNMKEEMGNSVVSLHSDKGQKST